MSRLRRVTLILGAVVVLAVGSGGGAHAQAAGAGSGVDVGACVVHAPANVTKPVTTTRCYGSLQEAMNTTAELANTVVGIEYKDSGYGGSSLVLTTGAGFACTGGRYVNFASMPAGWDNTIGSARAYASCRSGHYQYTNNGGALQVCGCSSMGYMNDRTSSIRFSASGT